MMTFRDFLQKKANEQNYPERQHRRDEWLAAIRRLMDQVKQWLQESDPDHILDCRETMYEVREPALGAYKAPGIRIVVGDEMVEIRPRDREALGYVDIPDEPPMRAQGRVDITNQGRRYILYRVKLEQTDRWYAIGDSVRARPLDRVVLESILQDLFS